MVTSMTSSRRLHVAVLLIRCSGCVFKSPEDFVALWLCACWWKMESECHSGLACVASACYMAISHERLRGATRTLFIKNLHESGCYCTTVAAPPPWIVHVLSARDFIFLSFFPPCVFYETLFLLWRLISSEKRRRKSSTGWKWNGP